MLRRISIMGCLWALWLAACPGWTQTNTSGFTNLAAVQLDSPSISNSNPSPIELSERLRAECINGRRSICGKILRIVPDGIIVECGYTNLLRNSLSGAWLLPGTVVADRARNLVESKEPNALCVGIVCLTHLPRGKPHPYDYVVISGYPMGQATYASVGKVTRTVRRFSASLEEAIKWNFAQEQQQMQVRQADKK